MSIHTNTTKYSLPIGDGIYFKRNKNDIIENAIPLRQQLRTHVMSCYNMEQLQDVSKYLIQQGCQPLYQGDPIIMKCKGLSSEELYNVTIIAHR